MVYWILLSLTILLWLGIGWFVSRRIGFFGRNPVPKFLLNQNGKVYDSAQCVYLTDGVEDLVHILHVFVDGEGRPFVYRPKLKHVQLFATFEEFDKFLRCHCGAGSVAALLPSSSMKLRFD